MSGWIIGRGVVGESAMSLYYLPHDWGRIYCTRFRLGGSTGQLHDILSPGYDEALIELAVVGLVRIGGGEVALSFF